MKINKKWSCGVYLAVGLLSFEIEAEGGLQPAAMILARVTDASSAETKAENSPALKLMSDMASYYQQRLDLSPNQAAEQWLVLANRMMSLEDAQWLPAAGQREAITGQYFSPGTLLAILPPPGAWQALTQLSHSTQYIPKDPQRAAALAFMVAALGTDRAAQYAALQRMRDVFADKQDQQNYAAENLLAQIENALIKAHGTPEQVLALLDMRLRSRNEFDSRLELPDLVNLVGDKAADDWLETALVSTTLDVRVPKGDATLRKAQAIALKRVSDLQVPHWGLVRGLDAAPLYEALTQRFGGQSSDRGRRSARSEAQTYYLLGLIAHGETAKAVSVSDALSSENDLEWSRKLLVEMDKQGYSKQIYQFLHAQLLRNPDIPLWDIYVKVAAYTGNTEPMLALLRSVIARPGKDTAAMRTRYAEGLLAVDHVDEAVGQLMAIAAQGEAEERLERGLQIATLGELQTNPEWLAQGLDMALMAATEPAVGRSSYSRDRTLKRLLSLLRRIGSDVMVQNLLVDELMRLKIEQKRFGADAYMPAALRGSSGEQSLAVEMAGLFADAERWQDALDWVVGYQGWRATDLSARYLVQDSKKMPLGWYVAKSLVMLNRQAEALPVLEALMSAKGGFDSAYELYAQIKGVASLPFFEQLYARDAFEERPLIWQAIVKLENGQIETARSDIERAIQIDPSDGEQGPGDRMRAYSVLADILERQDKAKDAAVYQSAVASIRWSERADRFHRAGLHQRAIALYTQSTEMFSNAYCVQSRLAIKLSNQGRNEEAAAHYRKAYELMPDSFGRVESHCFGCESVFQHPAAQTIAEDVFLGMLEKGDAKAQVTYMLGYLRMEQGRYVEAAENFRTAVSMDPLYLNAWKQLYRVSDYVYLEGWERDIAVLKLLELDPEQRHVKINVDTVLDLKGLWYQAAENIDHRLQHPNHLLFLAAASTAMEQAEASLESRGDVGRGRQRLMDEPGSDAVTPGMFLAQTAMLGRALEFAYAR